MQQVNTVTGPIPVEELGRTLMHEHVLIAWPGWELDSAYRFDREAALQRAIEALSEIKSLGVDSLVDPCPMELGRDPEFLAEVSAGSGVRIICATGLYYERLGIPTYFKQRTIDEIAEIYVREITEGIGGTGIRAGIIKCATGLNRIGKHEEKALRAAARASKATGVPVTTHTEGGTMGPEQLDVFASEGLDLGQVVIGHSCGSPNLEYHLKMLDRGATIGFDRIGLEMLLPDKIRLAALVGLIGAGYADQIVLSQDHVACHAGRPLAREDVLETMGKPSFAYLIKDFLPRVEATGVARSTIDSMMIGNPRRLFERATRQA
ncbi:MAG TPA: phosphotriesterase-related protein [Dehalococcoidia bacterium]|nr:phosphotriesterase-related protein [Dehalococcoidia bacterium]